MQSAFQSKPKVAVEVSFVEDDFVCPLCESFSVEEGKYRNKCFTCGTTWKTIETSN